MVAAQGHDVPGGSCWRVASAASLQLCVRARRVAPWWQILLGQLVGDFLHARLVVFSCSMRSSAVQQLRRQLAAGAQGAKPRCAAQTRHVVLLAVISTVPSSAVVTKYCSHVQLVGEEAP